MNNTELICPVFILTQFAGCLINERKALEFTQCYKLLILPL